MAAQQIDSTCLDMFDYNEAEMLLTLYFANGRAYVYYDVDPSVVIAFIGAESKGKFFTREIRDLYRYTRVYPQYTVTEIHDPKPNRR